VDHGGEVSRKVFSPFLDRDGVFLEDERDTRRWVLLQVVDVAPRQQEVQRGGSGILVGGGRGVAELGDLLGRHEAGRAADVGHRRQAAHL
jgi:hypothetical protein